VTEGLTGAELAAVANAASIAAIKDYLKAHGKEPEGGPGDFEITMHEFEQAVKETKRETPSVSRNQRLGIG
jgi:SpoVK/Ycf46/Vps4 family AAA+-type ATPase